LVANRTWRGATGAAIWKKAVAVHANKARTRRKKEDDWRSMVMMVRGWAVWWGMEGGKDDGSIERRGQKIRHYIESVFRSSWCVCIVQGQSISFLVVLGAWLPFAECT